MQSRVAQVVQAYKPGFEDFSNLSEFLRIFVVSKGENEASHRRWKGCPQSSILNLQSSVLSPQSSVLSPQKCSQKLDLRHFSRECRDSYFCASQRCVDYSRFILLCVTEVSVDYLGFILLCVTELCWLFGGGTIDSKIVTRLPSNPWTLGLLLVTQASSSNKKHW